MNGVVAAVVVAAGRGFRAGGEGPKQYREIGGEPIIRSSLKGLTGHPGIAMVQPVIHPDDADLFRAGDQWGRFLLGHPADDESSACGHELQQCLSVGLVVGGSIVIPHLRRAVDRWSEVERFAN